MESTFGSYNSQHVKSMLGVGFEPTSTQTGKHIQ